jgi:cell filamentation protein
MTSGFSKYDREEVTQSPYCYPDTNILKNKAGIKDSEALAKFEADVTAIRQYILEKRPIKGKFGIAHLKNIHKFIFQDVYPFAGKFRLEDIWKEDTFFCKSQFIEANLNSLLARLACENWLKGLSEDYFVQKAAYYMSELNMIHPFREGNGRTIREFIRCIALKSGLDIDWSLINHQKLLDATIRAVDNIYEPLEKCLGIVIVKAQ